jgi:hypothetical protein
MEGMVDLIMYAFINQCLKSSIANPENTSEVTLFLSHLNKRKDQLCQYAFCLLFLISSNSSLNSFLNVFKKTNSNCVWKGTQRNENLTVIWHNMPYVNTWISVSLSWNVENHEWFHFRSFRRERTSQWITIGWCLLRRLNFYAEQCKSPWCNIKDL